jgi:cytochrome P450
MPKLPSASIVENVRFNRTVIVPNALQGIFKRRPVPVKAATALDVDGDGAALLSGLRDKHGGLPVWVRVVKDPALLLLDVADVRRVLEGSPDPFAADPEAKRKGMAHFQPEALTISRGDLWRERRAFADAVLGAAPLERFAALAREEVAGTPDGEITFASLHAGFRRLTRRMVLGDAARDDEALSEALAELMGEANGLPSEPSPRYGEYAARVAEYVDAAEEGSLAGIAAEVEVPPDVRKPGQFTHWLFATQDTLALNVLRALALLAAHPGEDDLPGTLQEAMRLWPTTPMLSRVTLSALAWHRVEVPAGTQVLVVNTFFHRDPARLGDAAHRFTPEGWGEGGAFRDDWGLNHFSHGPQGCPGATLAVHVGVAALAAILDRGRPRLVDGGGKLKNGEPVPHMLDPFALKLSPA